MGTFFISAVASLVYVFLRSFQQLNVVHGHYWRIPFGSIGLGVLDVFLVLIIVKAETLWIGVVNGMGGALGCYAAMWLNRRLA